MSSLGEIAVRAMIPSDLTAVVNLERSIFPDPWSREAFSDSIEFPSCGGLVAESIVPQPDSEKTIVGYACYYTAAGETHLTNIAVSKQFRRKGVAERLMSDIFAKARESESEAIFLEVRASNIAAQALYGRFGFRELYRRKAYYSQPKEDAIVFVCELIDAQE